MHHGQENLVGISIRLPENLQLALVADVMANGPPEPPGAQHRPTDTAEQTPEYWLASGMEYNADHWPLD